MRLNRRQIRKMLMREFRHLIEGDGEWQLSREGEDKYGDVTAIIYKILHNDPETGKGPNMLGVNGYQMEEFSPGRYDDMDGVVIISGMNNTREAEHVIQILKNDGRLDKYINDLYISAETGRGGAYVFVAFN